MFEDNKFAQAVRNFFIEMFDARSVCFFSGLYSLFCLLVVISHRSIFKMNRVREKAFWIDFIKMYRNRPVLWKVKSKIYKQRNLKRQAYQQLAIKLRRLFPDANVEMVKRKINSIRACYRREMARIRDNRQAIANDEKVEEYKPSWWLFQHLEFLTTQVADENSPKEEEEEELMEEQEMLNIEEEEADLDKFDTDVPSVSSCNEEELEPDEPQTSSLQCIDFLDVTSSNRKPTTQQQYEQADNEADIYGRCWAIQYKDLSAEQKIYAKKAIEDIFFEAKLGTLQRNSVKINENAKLERN